MDGRTHRSEQDMFASFHIAVLPESVSLLHPAIVVGSWFGMGLVEPLRAGLAVASVVPLAVLLSGRSPLLLVVAALLVGVTGMWAAHAWEALVSLKDDRRIVVDEVAGYLAGMALIGRTGWLAGGCFAAAFLALDRAKPWPFNQIEGFHGGVGVMLDDLAVAVPLAAAVLLIAAAGRRIGRFERRSG